MMWWDHPGSVKKPTLDNLGVRKALHGYNTPGTACGGNYRQNWVLHIITCVSRILFFPLYSFAVSHFNLLLSDSAFVSPSPEIGSDRCPQVDISEELGSSKYNVFSPAQLHTEKGQVVKHCFFPRNASNSSLFYNIICLWWQSTWHTVCDKWQECILGP